MTSPRRTLVERSLLYLRTARALQWRQLAYRPLRRFQRVLPLPSAAAAPVSRERSRCMAGAVAAWGPHDLAASLERADAVAAGQFVFLSHAEQLPTIDWRREYVSRLWTYNLHYFDFARDLAWAFVHTGDGRYARRFGDLALSWIDDTRSAGDTGWEPYPVSLRIVNWTIALLLLGDAVAAPARKRIAESLHRHCRFLERRLEWQILANHLQRNLHALVIGGLFFDDERAARWRREGTRVLWRELDAQMLEDGGHIERSPMYHALVVGDLLELVSLMRVCEEEVPARVLGHARRGAAVVGNLSRSDGTLHQFNDSADGIAPPRVYLERLARLATDAGIEDPVGVWSLPASGYYGYRSPRAGDRFIIDCGEPGPAFQPGHAHCDLLSFELELGGVPFVVDSGVSGYDGDPLREYSRSTRAHSTVTVNGREQSEVWGTFRMARMARVVDAKLAGAPTGFRFRGAYQPYHDRRVTHARRVTLSGAEWLIEDEVQGAKGARLSSFLHLHPGVRLEADGDGFRAAGNGLAARIDPFGVDGARIHSGQRAPAQGWYCPRFGSCDAAPVLDLRIERNDGRPFGYRITTA